MRTKIILFILLFHAESKGQSPMMPFELERYPAEMYASSVHSGPFDNLNHALETYLSEYKRQRASEPSKYFPPSTPPRKNAAMYIQTHFPEGESSALIHFFETEGSQAACIDLLTSAGDLSHIIPYRFLAAHLLKNEEKEKQALLEMSQRGMLSEFLIAFGQNMRNSARDSDAIITNGFQDLIAVRAAQLIRNSNRNIPVYNIFAQKCKAFAGTPAASILSGRDKVVWVSPVMTVDFFRQYEDQLWNTGIGYTYAAELSNPEFPIAGLLSAAGLFEMPAVDPSSLNPSLKGLANAYKPFMQLLDSYVVVSGSTVERNNARKIAEYLEPYWK